MELVFLTSNPMQQNQKNSGTSVMDKKPNAFKNTSGSPDAINSVGGTSPITKRRRSDHRHRRNNAQRMSSHEKEKQIKRRMDLKILMFTVPSLLLLVGGILWFVSHINPDESMRPKGLIRLSYYMLIAGGIFFALALVVDWTKKILQYRKNKRDKATSSSISTRRRSAHHRHRRNPDV